MSDLWDCFGQVIKEDRLQLCQNGRFTLKGGEGASGYKTTVLAKNNGNLVVFDMGKNSHASFVNDGYNYNCDYIFIQVSSNEVSFILCELKKSSNSNNKAFKQLKYSIPLAHYLRQLLITHCGEKLERLKINCKKILLIKNSVEKGTIKNKPEIDNDVYMFYGEEFSLIELFNQ